MRIGPVQEYGQARALPAAVAYFGIALAPSASAATNVLVKGVGSAVA